MKRRRFKDTDFNEDRVIDMNDMKSMFREYIMMKMEEDFEEVIRKYFNKEEEDTNLNLK